MVRDWHVKAWRDRKKQFGKYDVMEDVTRSAQDGRSIRQPLRTRKAAEMKKHQLTAARCCFRSNRRIAGIISLTAVFTSFVLISTALCIEPPKSLTGKVVDASTNEALPFATIAIQNSSIHTSADARGMFRIAFPSRASTVVVSYVGYATKSVKVNQYDSLLVMLTPVGCATNEVSVVGTRSVERIENAYTLGSAQIKDFAGVTRDPMRSVQFLPGVSSNNEESAKFDVRGGTWDENLVVVDGAEMQDPYHVKEFSLASIGIFNADLVKSIDFSAGGFGAKYGNALSSIMEINYKDGDRKRTRGSISLSPLDFSASFQGPIGSKVSYIVAARRSYIYDMVQLMKIVPDVYASYYDVQGRFLYEPDELDRLRVTFIYSKDFASFTPAEMASQYASLGNVQGKSALVTRNLTQDWSLHGNYSSALISMSSENVINNRLTSRTQLYYSGETEQARPVQVSQISLRYQGFPDYWTTQTVLDDESYAVVTDMISFNQEMDYKVSKVADIQAGMYGRRISYNYNPMIRHTTTTTTNISRFPDTSMTATKDFVIGFDTLSIISPAYTAGAFVQEEINITSNLTVNIGARYDYCSMDQEGAYSPRINVTYRMPFEMKVSGAWGIYYELPRYNQWRVSYPSASNTKFQKAIHYVLSLEKSFSSLGSLRADFYQKNYSDLIPAVTLTYGQLTYISKQNSAIGFARGMDLQWAATYRALALTVNYSYLVSKEKSPGIDADYYPRVSDQRHTASVSLLLRMGKNWTFNLKGLYGSGYAYTPKIVRYDSTVMLGIWVPGQKNSDHYPAYERVDIKLAKTLYLFNNPLLAFIEVMNVFNRKNVWSYRYTYDGKGNPLAQPIVLLGLIPSIGLTYRIGN